MKDEVLDAPVFQVVDADGDCDSTYHLLADVIVQARNNHNTCSTAWTRSSRAAMINDKDATIRTRRPRLTIVMYGLLLYLFKLGISVNKRTKRLIRRSLKRRGDHGVGEEAVHFFLGTHDHRDPTL
jgi:hypothetical protein